ncbi:MAG: dTDP-glucose 4,6-dehydratase [Myxococcota bacterium]
MKVLVTGGAGFIGANFLLHSVPARRNAQFLNLDALTYAANPKSLAAIEDDARYRFERVDITDGEAVRQSVDAFDPDLIVHFAAESHVDRSILGPKQFVRTNIEGTFNLLEACRARPDRLFHHVSTDEVYGSLGDEGFFTEDTAYDPSSPYSASKAASDHLVRAYHRTYGMPVKITNCSNNYGPLQFPEKLVPLMILNAVEGKALPIYGTGLNVRDWLYVEDHCRAIWAVIDKGEVGETYNVGGHNEKTNIDVVDTLCALVAEALGKEKDALLDLKTFVQDRPGHDHRYAIDASKIERECHWKPAESFETGMKKTVAWYLENNEWVHDVRSGDYKRWIEANYGAR